MLGRNLSALVTKMVRFDTEKAIAIEVLADGSEPKLVTMFVSYLTHDGPTVGEFDRLHRNRANRSAESESICQRVCSPEDGRSPQPSNVSPAGPFLSHRIAHPFGTVAVVFLLTWGTVPLAEAAFAVLRIRIEIRWKSSLRVFPVEVPWLLLSQPAPGWCS